MSPMPMVATGAAVFARENIKDAWAEMYPLFEKHWVEIAQHKDIPLAPDRDLYVKMDELGALRVYTAREAGVLVGYSVYSVTPHLHYASCKLATQDVLFIQKDKRGRFGARFIAWCDEQLRGQDVQIVAHHVKVAHDFGPLLERMGYSCVEKIYMRRLY